jgi:hypothetical protein
MAASYPDVFRLSFDLTDLVDIAYTPVMDIPKKSTDYLKLVEKEFYKLEKLQRQRNDLDVEIAKSKQFIAATANMLDDEERESVLTAIAVIEQVEKIAEAGLTEAIRSVLKKNYKEWLTVTKVRDQLKSAGFDFSGYKSSPLASISTTLKRFKSEDVETAEIDGVAAFRWIGKILMESPKTSSFYGESGPVLGTIQWGDLGRLKALKDMK